MLTAAQINAATRALHGKKTAAHRARSAFESALAKPDAFKETRVNESAGRVTFTRAPIRSVRLFAKVIAAVKLPAKWPRHRCAIHGAVRMGESSRGRA